MKYGSEVFGLYREITEIDGCLLKEQHYKSLQGVHTLMVVIDDSTEMETMNMVEVPGQGGGDQVEGCTQQQMKEQGRGRETYLKGQQLV